VRVRVLKFSGSSLAGIERIQAAADRVVETLRAGLHPLVVVAAMAGVTDQLLALGRQLHRDPPGEELDRLLATGELQTASLLAIALHERGVAARSFSGAEAGLSTDRSFGRARLRKLNSTPVSAAIAASEIPVVAGFQGATDDGRVTTLGRGGADLSAVALGVAHSADRIVMVRDVEGVRSADPRLLPLSYRLERLDYQSMIDLAHAGAPMIHPQALEMARAHSIGFELRGLTSRSDSTFVGEECGVTALPVWMIMLSHPVSVISIDSLPHDVGMIARLLRLLDRTDLKLDGAVQKTDSESGLCMSVILADLEGPTLFEQLRDFLREERGLHFTLERRQRRVTIVGRGIGSRRVQRAIDTVAQRLGPPMVSFSGPRHRTFLVGDHEGQDWLASLHQELIGH
jgi:aspartate kinase